MGKKKVMFIASEGGHLTQLLQLKPLFSEFESYLLSEKDNSTIDLKKRHGDAATVHLLPKVRKAKPIKYNLERLLLLFASFFKFLKIWPDVVVSTGAITGVFICYFAKLFRKKIIFFETYASIKNPSQAAKLVYPIADRFYVQWPSMKQFYPKAIFIGSLY